MTYEFEDFEESNETLAEMRERWQYEKMSYTNEVDFPIRYARIFQFLAVLLIDHTCSFQGGT